MWDIRNKTPFAVDGSFERDKKGDEVWCLAVRAGFDVEQDGLLCLSEHQSDVEIAPKYDSESANELLCDGDIAPFRPATDIVLKGDICTRPSDAKIKSVGFRVGKLQKAAVVSGERRLEVKDGKASLIAHEPLDERITLSWNNAYGGRDLARDGNELYPENPIGIGHCGKPLSEMQDGFAVDLPRIENPDQPISDSSGPVAPHGFGPIQRFWEPRKADAGTYDEAWQRHQAPLLPKDFDERFYQSSPRDQIYDGYIKGGEPVTIKGFHLEGDYHYRLPQIVFEAQSRFGGQKLTTRFRCVSVEINPATKSLEMVWNSHVPCSGADHLISQSRVMIKQMAGVR